MLKRTMEILKILPNALSRSISPKCDNKSSTRRIGLEIVNHAYQLCKEYLQGPWAQISLHEFEITPLGGGLTNKLYICNLPPKYRNNDNESSCPNTVLLRLYGLILQDFKAQIQESVVFSILAERGLGPKLFAVFPGGRLEEFLPCRTLTTPDLATGLSPLIAERVSEYHRLSMPVKKDPTFIMNKLFVYLEKSKNVSFHDNFKQALLEKFRSYDIQSEVEYITDMIANMNPVVVFCHNDVQEGNLLYAERDDGQNPVQMIDFEYSSYNYRGFDLGNHFCEWMYDYSYTTWPFYEYNPENYPSKQQQETFVSSYLASMYAAVPARQEDPRWQPKYVLEEAERLALLSHLFWSLWSVVQAQISDIGFGYMEYCLARMDAYFRHKKSLSLPRKP